MSDDSKYSSKPSMNKNNPPLILAVFILSVLLGVLQGVVVNYWYNRNISLIKQIQAKDETYRLEQLLDQNYPR